MVRSKKLIWNVYIENINRREISLYNIFEYGGLQQTFKKLKKKYNDDKENFFKEIRRELMYRFWCKSEWEITLWNWPPSDKFNYKKIDVFTQIENNWDAFTQYIWDNL